jgi:hypothetical protein
LKEAIMRAAWLALLTVTGAVGVAAPAAAQPLPPGSYRSDCRNYRVEGMFLSASCRAPGGGWAQSQINVNSCAGRDIYVGRDGGLACNVNERPITRPPPTRPPPVVRPPPPGGGWGGRGEITVYGKRNFKGASQRFRGEVPNLDRSGFNDRIRSIEIGRRGGTWQVCSDAYFRGRCQTVSRDIGDTRAIGLDRNISSIRRVR